MGKARVGKEIYSRMDESFVIMKGLSSDKIFLACVGLLSKTHEHLHWSNTFRLTYPFVFPV